MKSYFFILLICFSLFSCQDNVTNMFSELNKEIKENIEKEEKEFSKLQANLDGKDRKSFLDQRFLRVNLNEYEKLNDSIIYLLNKKDKNSEHNIDVSHEIFQNGMISQLNERARKITSMICEREKMDNKDCINELAIKQEKIDGFPKIAMITLIMEQHNSLLKKMNRFLKEKPKQLEIKKEFNNEK